MKYSAGSARVEILDAREPAGHFGVDQRVDDEPCRCWAACASIDADQSPHSASSVTTSRMTLLSTSVAMRRYRRVSAMI